MTSPELQDRFQTLIDEHKKILYKVCNSYCRNVRTGRTSPRRS
jgi:hypothetical protein